MVEAPLELVQRELYGGAISLRIPSVFVDVSDFRPVPDHQEVWADGATDRSLVVEVVEHAAVPDSDAPEFYWKDACAGNDATNNNLGGSDANVPLDASLSERGCTACLAHGTQWVSKGRQSESAANRVEVFLGVVRIPRASTDIITCLHLPSYISPESASAREVAPGERGALDAGVEVLREILASLRVQDWGLFG
ncbi:unnamed protein product [Pedinophyceae sp. YPF-701]|nr:unnamed protein product [Pedinophyceae sp. YPF-701]